MDRHIKVTQVINVSVDETKFDEKFMQEFREGFYNFYTVQDHMKHLGQLYARGIYDEFSAFIEGYGPPAEMGIKFSLVYQEDEIDYRTY